MSRLGSALALLLVAVAAAAQPPSSCVACHGEKGEGNQELGAPRLSNDIWLYDGETASIAAQIANPKHGVMPAIHIHK